MAAAGDSCSAAGNRGGWRSTLLQLALRLRAVVDAAAAPYQDQGTTRR